MPHVSHLTFKLIFPIIEDHVFGVKRMKGGYSQKSCNCFIFYYTFVTKYIFNLKK
jgi:hypothetical protein